MVCLIIGFAVLVFCAFLLEYAEHKGHPKAKTYIMFGADFGLCLSAITAVQRFSWAGIIYMVLIASISRIIGKILFNAYKDAKTEEESL